MQKQELYNVTPPVSERFKSPLSQTNGSCVTFAPIKDEGDHLIGIYMGDSQNPDIQGTRYTPEEFIAMADGIDSIRKRLGL
ncbi:MULTISPECIES: DUF397 domain-containing protein [Kitasatospora]|uniref:DUF397 domain-containing protein n=1 Tax=Kitasatospora TaxID=2063 RepID=UPI000C6FCD29|nr:DUF397 domain-containing protein [Kitasatospora sp. GP30]MDH6139663.1 hypothetical protein [Kitasatospora sp. GP30]